MKRKATTIIIILVFFAGLSLMLYPTVSNWYNSLHQGQAIVDYGNEVDALEAQVYEELFREARAYNDALRKKGNRIELSQEERSFYETALLPGENSVMAYVEIPAINCMLPIRHGTEENVLDNSVGHLEWSSLPVGGESTHCVISAHSGLPSSELFTNLDQVELGDVFTIHVLNEELEYRVDHIAVVEPLDYSLLWVSEGEDHVTLMTCTPYGINSHRLLVRGVRMAAEGTAPESVAVSNEVEMLDTSYLVPVTVLTLAGVLFLVFLFTGRKEKDRKSEK